MTDPRQELCVDVYYPAKHGRQHPKDPWSGMRHTGLYIGYNIKRKILNCVLLQPPSALRKRFPEALGTVPGASRNAALAPLLFLSVAKQDWREYLNHLESEIYKLVITFACLLHGSG